MPSIETIVEAPDVFVIGGGPAGLAAAIAARRRGLSVTLADAARPPIDKACGEGLMPDALAALKTLGVELEAADAQPFGGIRFVDRGISFASTFPGGAGLGVRRTVLHARMAEAANAAGVRMWWGRPVDIQTVKARWIVGADGMHSRLRGRVLRQRGFTGMHLHRGRRFGFRTHYSISPWTDFMELHWGAGCQIYVTPVAPGEVCAALISRDPHLRLDDALPQFPELAARLVRAPRASPERGAITANCRLARVYRGNLALIGDASGSVDAVTGEGLCLAFRQAIALAESLVSGDLAAYEAAHRRLARRPMCMSNLMLTLDRYPLLRYSAFRAMAFEPRIFQSLLSFHLCVPDFS